MNEEKKFFQHVKKLNKRPKFSFSEAQEIYYALEHKYVCVKRGDYRCTIADDQSASMMRECVKHEDRLQREWTESLARLVIVGRERKGIIV